MLRLVLACLAGLLLGGLVNMGLVVLGPTLIPPPDGLDVTNAESLRNGIHLLEPRHFLVPFLAHALGTLVGSATAFLVATSHRATCAYVVGALFLCGGIAASFMIPAPTWFIVLDLGAAYFPMAWLGAAIGKRFGPRATV